MRFTDNSWDSIGFEHDKFETGDSIIQSRGKCKYMKKRSRGQLICNSNGPKTYVSKHSNTDLNVDFQL